MLSDTELRRVTDPTYFGPDAVAIAPTPQDRQYQPVSIDLGLGALMGAMRLATRGYWLEAGQFILASTLEEVRMPDTLVGLVSGKSTLARRGLLVEAAGLVDPGFKGTITLELKNLGHQRIRLELEMLICQISFLAVEGVVSRPYGSPGLGSHYQGQRGPTPAWEEGRGELWRK